MPVASSTTRVDRVLADLADRELDALLVTNLTDVRYLSGYTGSNGLVVIGADTRRFITDFRYKSQAAEQVDAFEVEIAAQELALALEDGWPAGELKVGYADDQVTVRALARLRELLPDRIELVEAGGVVAGVRAVKDAGEIEQIRAAAQLADQVLEWLVEQPIVGQTEFDLATAVEHKMRRLGALRPSFDTIVASGTHGALPHASPRHVEVPADVLITFDMGAYLDGYCSDITRTFATGAISDELRAMYDLVLHAQKTSLAAVRPGPSGREIDAVARDIIDAAGHQDHFGHGLGHGVGMEIHEAPRLAKTGETVLVPGHIVTVEPGVYVPDVGGVRIEDLCAVTGDGTDVLSSFTKDLLTVH